MDANKTSFETNFWIRQETESPLKVIDAFFQSNDLDNYKHLLGDVMMHLRKEEVCQTKYPGVVFAFYTSVRSLLKACYCLQFSSTRWKVAAPSGCNSVLHQASLTKEEYHDPCLVFCNAFAVKTLENFEAFFSEAVELALSPYTDDGYWDVMAFYIYLVKMLDAAWLIRERGIEKIEKLKNNTESL